MSWIDDLLSDPRKLNSADTAIDTGGQVIGALSHLQYGQQAQESAQYQATQLRQNAGQAQAAAQRQAFDVDRQSQYIASAALAAAAAGGGGASDPTVVRLIAHNAGEMAYRKSLALYGGDDRARTMNMQADAKEYEGENIAANSKLVAGSQLFKAGSTLMKGTAKDSSLFSRFGAGWPGANPGG